MSFLKENTLWSKTLERSREAVRKGALVPIPTRWEFLEDGGVRFLIRLLPNRLRKAEQQKRHEALRAAGQEVNPFLPYDEDLFVADLSESHICLLNKFNVVDCHLLMVTRVYEDQDSPLKLEDFHAIVTCLREFDGLAFYNAGKAAGASQSHKHLQYVPLPLTNDGPSVPIEPLIASTLSKNQIAACSRLPFLHAAAGLDWLSGNPSEGAAAALNLYRRMLQKTGATTSPHNLLATRRWMLVVPRSRECFSTISINSLGFAGSLLARDERERRLLKSSGPMAILKEVARVDDFRSS